MGHAGLSQPGSLADKGQQPHSRPCVWPLLPPALGRGGGLWDGGKEAGTEWGATHMWTGIQDWLARQRLLQVNVCWSMNK